MKKAIIILCVVLLAATGIYAQNDAQKLQQYVTRLDNASTAKDYQQLAVDFERIAETAKTQWLPYYYAAYCNAKTAWLNQDDPDNIEGFANKADAQIKKAQALLDTAVQKKELSEVYCVLSMVNRAKVFMNPTTYGPQYGPIATRFVQLAKSVDAANGRAFYLDGWEKFVTPKMWGGDKLKAKELLLQAQQKLAAENAGSIQPHWGKKEVEELLKQLK